MVMSAFLVWLAGSVVEAATVIVARYRGDVSRYLSRNKGDALFVAVDIALMAVTITW